MSKHNVELQLAELALFTHGVLFALHVLGLTYNLKRRNKVDVACHAGAAVYDAWALLNHMDDVYKLKGA